MFTYPIHSNAHCSISRLQSPRKKMQQFKVDLEEFRKKAGLYIRNERTIDENMKKDLNEVFKKIRRDAKSNPNQLDTSYKTDESFLSANSSVAGDDTDTVATLGASERKTLALTLMKVFREDVTKLEEADQIYFACSILRDLGVNRNRWIDFHVEKTN